MLGMWAELCLRIPKLQKWFGAEMGFEVPDPDFSFD